MNKYSLIKFSLLCIVASVSSQSIAQSYRQSWAPGRFSEDFEHTAKRFYETLASKKIQRAHISKFIYGYDEALEDRRVFNVQKFYERFTADQFSVLKHIEFDNETILLFGIYLNSSEDKEKIEQYMKSFSYPSFVDVWKKTESGWKVIPGEAALHDGFSLDTPSPIAYTVFFSSMEDAVRNDLRAHEIESEKHALELSRDMEVKKAIAEAIQSRIDVEN